MNEVILLLMGDVSPNLIHTCLLPVTLLTRLHIFRAGPNFKFMYFIIVSKLSSRNALPSISWMKKRSQSVTSYWHRKRSSAQTQYLHAFWINQHARPEPNPFRKCIVWHLRCSIHSAAHRGFYVWPVAAIGSTMWWSSWHLVPSSDDREHWILWS